MKLAAVGVAVALLGAGCGGGSGHPTAARSSVPIATPLRPTPTPTVAAADPMPAALRYIQAESADDPDVMLTGRSAAVPGSPADRYIIVQAAVQRATVQAGQSSVTSSAVRREGTSISLCESDTSGTICTTFSAFKGDAAGRVRTFTVNGRPIEPRLSRRAGPPISAPGGGSVQLVGAYRTVTSDALMVALQVRSGAAGLQLVQAAAYRTPAGEQRATSDWTNVTTYAANAQAIAVYYIRGADPGGVLTIMAGTPNGDLATLHIPA